MNLDTKRNRMEMGWPRGQFKSRIFLGPAKELRGTESKLPSGSHRRPSKGQASGRAALTACPPWLQGQSHPLHSRSNKTKEPQNKNCLRWTNTSVWQGNRGRRLPLLSHDPEERVFTAEDRRTLSPLHFCSRESAAHSEDVLCFVVVSVHSSEV